MISACHYRQVAGDRGSTPRQRASLEFMSPSGCLEHLIFIFAFLFFSGAFAWNTSYLFLHFFFFRGPLLAIRVLVFTYTSVDFKGLVGMLGHDFLEGLFGMQRENFPSAHSDFADSRKSGGWISPLLLLLLLILKGPWTYICSRGLCALFLTSRSNCHWGLGKYADDTYKVAHIARLPSS